MVSPLPPGFPKRPPDTVHVLTREQRIEIVSALRFRAYQIREHLRLEFLPEKSRAGYVEDVERLTNLADLLEFKDITVSAPQRGHAS